MAWPRRSRFFTASVAATMKLTSGSLNLDSGVGTQIEIASGSDRRAMSVVELKRPHSMASFSCESVTSLTWERPCVEPLDHIGVDVEPEDPIAGTSQLDRQGQPHVAQPDDPEEDLPAFGLGDQVLGNAHSIGLNGRRIARSR